MDPESREVGFERHTNTLKNAYEERRMGVTYSWIKRKHA